MTTAIELVNVSKLYRRYSGRQFATLKSALLKRSLLRELRPDPAVEQVKAVDGAILWATKRDALGRSVMRKLIAGAAYKELTVRSLNTTLKLHELLAARPP